MYNSRNSPNVAKSVRWQYVGVVERNRDDGCSLVNQIYALSNLRQVNCWSARPPPDLKTNTARDWRYQGIRGRQKKHLSIWSVSPSMMRACLLRMTWKYSSALLLIYYTLAYRGRDTNRHDLVRQSWLFIKGTPIRSIIKKNETNFRRCREMQTLKSHCAQVTNSITMTVIKPHYYIIFSKKKKKRSFFMTEALGLYIQNIRSHSPSFQSRAQSRITENWNTGQTKRSTIANPLLFVTDLLPHTRRISSSSVYVLTRTDLQTLVVYYRDLCRRQTSQNQQAVLSTKYMHE